MRNLILFSALALASAASAQVFTDGVFVLNEDWYGHNNSTLNFWNTNQKYCDYLIYQQINPGHSLGATAQYAQIFGDKMYVMSKQDVDPGDKSGLVSGRLVIMDAKKLTAGTTLPSLCLDGEKSADGRAICGVTPGKMYVGTTNGILVYDTAAKSFTKRIEGTLNPLITGEENPADGLGALYNNQIGMMIRTQDYVFAVMQDKGILAIDPVSDKVAATIDGCFATIAQDCNGNIWAGMNSNADYQKYPYGNNGDKWDGSTMLKIDQYSLETEKVTLAAGGINNSWYAWTAGMLCAHPSEPYLYFVYHDPSLGQQTWFCSNQLYRFNTETYKVDLIYDSSADNAHFYSSGVRVNPKDGNIYGFLYIGDNIATQDWLYFSMNPDGEMLAAFTPIKRYWYPSLAFFPDTEGPTITGMPERVVLDGSAQRIALADMVHDPDTPKASIIARITANTCPEAVEARIERGELLLTPIGIGEADVEVTFDSNGLLAAATLHAEALAPAGIDDAAPDISAPAEYYNLQGMRVAPRHGGIYIIRDAAGSRVARY